MKTVFLITSTNEVPKYADSLRNLNLGPVDLLQYDLLARSAEMLFARLKEAAPDLVVYIGSRWGQTLALARLSHISNNIAPMVHLCSDAADPPWWDMLREYHQAGAFTLQVAIDGSHKWPLSSNQMTALTPVDAALFPQVLKPHTERGIVAGYAGNAGGGPESKRTVMLSELLRQRVIDVRIRSNLPYTYESFCDFVANCRMSLNIAYSGTEVALQVKGRVLESGIAGACLLETKGAPTSYWFRPGIDYLEYESADEAAEIIKRLAHEPQETQAIGDSLRRRVLAEHSPEKFWTRIFFRIGLKVAPEPKAAAA